MNSQEKHQRAIFTIEALMQEDRVISIKDAY